MKPRCPDGNLRSSLSGYTRRLIRPSLRHLVLACVAFASLGCRSLPTPVPPLRWSPSPSDVASPTTTASPRGTQQPTATATSVRGTATVSPSVKPLPSPTPSPSEPRGPRLIGTFAVDHLPAPGRQPSGVAVLGSRVYVSNRGSDNVSIVVDGSVHSVVPVGREPSAVVADARTGRVFVLNERDGTITIIEGTVAVDTWTLAEEPSCLTVVGERLWVGTMRGGRIMVLSAQDGSASDEVSLASGSAVLNLIASPDGSRLYAATYGDLHVIETSSGEEVAAASTDGYRTLGLSPEESWVYLTEYDSGARQTYLTILSGSTLRRERRVPIPPGPSNLTVDPRDGRIYLLSGLDHSLTVLDGADHKVVADLVVGYGPSHAALDVESGLLYVANRDGDSLSVVDTADLALIETVPLALILEDMDVDPDTGKLYVAVASSDRVYVLGDEGLLDEWHVGRYPHHVRAIPSEGRAAILSLADRKLLLLDRAGQVLQAYDTGRNPHGLLVDESRKRVYAGDIVVEWDQQTAQTVRVPTIYRSEEPPLQVVLDTRRDRVYAVSFNGTPGSNGGYVVTRLGERGFDPALPAPGRLSVVDLIYDQELDRFYATNGRMGQYGIEVSQAVDAQELLYMPLDGHPSTMALNLATWHLWVALSGPTGRGGSGGSVVVAYDTRSMTQVARLAVDDLIESMTIDQRRNRVYLGSAETGVVYVVEDVLMPVAAEQLFLEDLADRPTATAAPPPTCIAPVDPALAEAWESLGGASGMGCPYGEAEEGDWGLELFERGRMCRREATGTVFLIFDDGEYLTYHDAWQEGMPALACDADPPSGLLQPVRGFGLIWCREAGVREKAGWALDVEQRHRAVYQTFAHGALLLVRPQGPVYALQSDGNWRALVAQED